jgi:hypothetical protein
MGRLTETVFNESCCDGGECLDDMSCQPCGCDKGANHVCEGHKMGAFLEATANMVMARPATSNISLPTDPAERKSLPIATGVLDYFPDALAEVARVSKIGNDQHNPGQPLHWAKEKSSDEADALIRHFLERGKRDSDGARHSAKVAWRALALLQREIDGERD